MNTTQNTGAPALAPMLFADLCRNVERRIAAAGGKIRGFHSPELPHFSALNEKMRNQVLLETRNFLESYSCEDREILDAEKRALWKSFSIYGIVPPPDLFDRLKENYAIEVYSLDGRQIWRNLACLELCSYTVEEIACLSVFDRYERPLFIERKCTSEVEALLCGRRAELFDPNILPHLARETRSEGNLTLSLKHELFAALRGRNGALKAWLAMTLGQLANEEPAILGNE